MTHSKNLAGLIGPVLMVVAVTEALNFHIWTSNIAPVVYLNGTLLLVAGLAIVRAHNLWAWRWPVLITLTGWALVLLGLFRMVAPDAPQAGQNAATYVMLAALFVVASVLTFKAYSLGGDDTGTAT